MNPTQDEKLENKSPKLLQDTFYITYVLLLTTGTICFIEAVRTKDIKIRNIEHAIEQAELMIKESKMSQEELIFLKRKISDSRQDLEILYLMKIQ